MTRGAKRSHAENFKMRKHTTPRITRSMMSKIPHLSPQEASKQLEALLVERDKIDAQLAKLKDKKPKS